MPRRPHLHTDILIRLPNWVGDVCMALPAIQALQASGLSCSLIGKGWATDLLAGLNVPVHKVASGTPAQIRQAQDITGTLTCLFTNSFGSAVAYRTAGKKPIGFRGDGRSAFLYRSLRKEKGRHEVDYFWQVAQKTAETAGRALPDAAPPQVSLPLTEQHYQQASEARANINGPYWVCCPLATGTIKGKSKIWPEWRKLDAELAARGIQVLACPGPGEEEACQQLLPHAVHLPHLSLGAYTALMTNSQQVVANDSGPMHLAAVAGASVLGVFGVGDPVRTRPWGGDYIGDAKTGWPSLADVLAQLGI